MRRGSLAREGKAVVWIDGGLHASRGARRAAARRDGLPDGESHGSGDDADPRQRHHPLRARQSRTATTCWPTGTCASRTRQERSTGNAPRLYQKYIGHDNNRDFFMSTQAETENISRVLYHQWMPQVLYNHHQSGPAGTVFWSPPLRDPYNYNLDPIVVLGLSGVRRGDALAAGRRGEAGRDDALRWAVRRLVEWRHSQHRLVPQRDRVADRDDRQPDAAAHSAGHEPAAAVGGPGVSRSRRRNGTSARAWTIRSRSIARC